MAPMRKSISGFFVGTITKTKSGPRKEWRNMKPKARVKRLIVGSALFGAGALGFGMMLSFGSWIAPLFALITAAGVLIALWPSPKTPKPPETEPEPYHNRI